MKIFQWKCVNFDEKNPLKFVHDYQYSRIGSENGLSPSWRQAIIWTNDCIVYRRIYAALGLNELVKTSGDWSYLRDLVILCWRLLKYRWGSLITWSSFDIWTIIFSGKHYVIFSNAFAMNHSMYSKIFLIWKSAKPDQSSIFTMHGYVNWRMLLQMLT